MCCHGLGWQPQKWLAKKAKKGNRGYPVGTVAFYGPDDKRASKVAVAVVPSEDGEPSDLRRWLSEHGDVRNDATIMAEVAVFLREGDIRSVIMTSGILGCPHEEGTDYEGDACPHCPFWARRDRWTGLESGAT